MIDTDIKLFYHRMMWNIVVDYIEDAFPVYFSHKSEILSLQVSEYRNFSRVIFNAVFISIDPFRTSDYVRMEGVIDVDSHGKVDEPESLTSEYLTDV